MSNELVHLETRQTHFIKLVTFCLASLAYKLTTNVFTYLLEYSQYTVKNTYNANQNDDDNTNHHYERLITMINADDGGIIFWLYCPNG